MSELLSKLLSAGLMEGLGGDDTRFEKIAIASDAVAKELLAKPVKLIPAILAGLDPDVPENDPAMLMAWKALQSTWKLVANVYSSRPVNLLRMMLLNACNQAAEGKKAAIVWFTAADVLPYMRLGKEEAAVREMLKDFSRRTEEESLSFSGTRTMDARGLAKWAALTASTVLAPGASKVDRNTWLLPRMMATVGPQGRDKMELQNPNPHMLRDSYHGSNSLQWGWEFADRMTALLADLWDYQSSELTKQQAKLVEQINGSQAKLVEAVNTFFTAQQQAMQQSIHASEAQRRGEQLRLHVLWWSEALYSTSLHRGYRELNPALAAMVMAADLLREAQDVMLPTPAAVAYLLSETVHRLPGADFSSRQSLSKWLNDLSAARQELPKEWPAEHFKKAPPSEGRLSLRDLVVQALKEGMSNLSPMVARSGLNDDIKLSLPELSRAVFRQEQALRLAGNLK